jgi:alpha-beta hydrolase superfamily lysophospholipase
LRYRFSPAVGSAIGTVVLVPGMMSHSGWSTELTHLVTELHLDVIGADRRGSGLNDWNRGDAPSREILVSDCRKIIEQERCDAPVYLMGWCWGALVVVNTALELGDALSGVVLLAPGLFPSEQIKRAAQHELTTLQNPDSNRPVLRSPISEEMFSDRSAVRDFIRNDVFAQRTFTPRFFRVSAQMSLIAAARLPQLTQPLLVLLAANDVVVDNGKTRMALQHLHRTDVTIAVLPCNHAMQFEVPDQIVSHISQWLNEQRRPSQSEPPNNHAERRI